MLILHENIYGTLYQKAGTEALPVHYATKNDLTSMSSFNDFKYFL